jgi:uncharacterized protein YecE (DUF72 family)
MPGPRILAGTCGFAYRDWKGRFHPPDLPASDRLAAYGERLDTVEIDATFYRPPARSRSPPGTAPCRPASPSP